MITDLPLPDESLPKALQCIRALRRAITSYWYATVEGREPAMIEAITGTMYVSILDETVFAPVHGEEYRNLRATSRLGRVVMGLGLIRNCETHSPELFVDLLVERAMYGVPFASGITAMRTVFSWAKNDGALGEIYAMPSQRLPSSSALNTNSPLSSCSKGSVFTTASTLSGP